MIDSHVHFWNFDPVRDSWITPEMNAIRNDFTPADFAKATSLTPISGCIAVQADQTENQNHFLLSLAKENPAIKGIVGWVDLCSNQLEERLNYWSNFKLIKGWRHVLQAEPDEFIVADRFAQGVRTLNNYGYTYDILCYHTQLPAIIQLVDKLEHQPLVLDHCGKPDVKNQDLEKWKENIKVLSQHPNVSCKISGLLVEADWDNWTEKQLFNCFDVIFEHFGADRVIYGSDWPVVLVSRPYKDWLSLVSKYTSRFTENERKQFFSGNVDRFYNLTSSDL